MKLNVRAFALACAIMWGCGVLFITLWIILFEGQTGSVLELAFSPDGKSFVATGQETARLWDLQTGQVVQIFSGHSSKVTGADFSPDGSSLACGNFLSNKPDSPASSDVSASVIEAATSGAKKRLRSFAAACSRVASNSIERPR